MQFIVNKIGARKRNKKKKLNLLVNRRLCTVQGILPLLSAGKYVHPNACHIGIWWRTRVSSGIGQIGLLNQQMRNGDIGLFRDHRHTASSRIEIDHIVVMEPENECRRLRTVIYGARNVDHIPLLHVYLWSVPNDSMWHWMRNDILWKKKNQPEFGQWASNEHTHRQLSNCRKDFAPAAWIFGIRSLLHRASTSTSIPVCIRPANDCTSLWIADQMCMCSRRQLIYECLDAVSKISTIDWMFFPNQIVYAFALKLRRAYYRFVAQILYFAFQLDGTSDDPNHRHIICGDRCIAQIEIWFVRCWCRPFHTINSRFLLPTCVSQHCENECVPLE